jgi:hypothetical protein
MAKKFNNLQVVRNKEMLRNDKGHFVPAGTRLVVIKEVGTTVTARLADRPTEAVGRLPRIVGEKTQFERTYRGRPKGSTRTATVVAEASTSAQESVIKNKRKS